MVNISVYEAIARNLGDLVIKGSPTGATASTVDSTDFHWKYTEQLAGRDIYIYQGVAAGQSRVIASYAPNSNRICITPAWTTTPTTGCDFIIFDKFQTTQYEHFMNRSMGRLKNSYLIDMTATMAIVGTQSEYLVPSGMEWINYLRLVPTAGSDYPNDDEVARRFDIPHREWTIERNYGGSYLFAFDPRKISISALDGQVIRVGGQGKPDFAATLIPEDLEEFIIADASYQMSAQMRGSNAKWDALYYMYRDIIKGTKDIPGLETYLFKYGAGKKVRP